MIYHLADDIISELDDDSRRRKLGRFLDIPNCCAEKSTDVCVIKRKFGFPAEKKEAICGIVLRRKEETYIPTRAESHSQRRCLQLKLCLRFYGLRLKKGSAWAVSFWWRHGPPDPARGHASPPLVVLVYGENARYSSNKYFLSQWIQGRIKLGGIRPEGVFISIFYEFRIYFPIGKYNL